jgi:hypothetical protein
VLRLDEIGVGEARPGVEVNSSDALFVKAVTRRFPILDAGRIFSEILLGMGGAAPVGRRGLRLEDPNEGGGCGGVRPSGVGIGALPEPTIVDGRLGGSMELIRGRKEGVSSDMVDVGRSTNQS